MTFEQENNILIQKYLEDQFFSFYRKGEKQLEIFLHGLCSANCEYCYLKKHQNEIYPTEINCIDTILTNLKKTLNWYIEQKFCCNIDIFSANWINTPYGPKVFDIFYEAFSKAPSYCRPRLISIPDNMQFLKDKASVENVTINIQRFQDIGIRISFSASVDGYYCDYGRTINDEQFYIDLKNFLTKYNYLPHPMISSNNIKDWIYNYQWWRNNFPDHIAADLMSLEVRDNTWDDNSINELIHFCDFLVDYKFEKDFQFDKKEFLKYILNLWPRFKEKNKTPPYNIIGLNLMSFCEGEQHIHCTLGKNCLAIRMGDLSVGLCHRLFYPELLLGKFNSDDIKLLDFDVKNPSLFIGYKQLNRSCIPYCEECLFQGVCVGHCHGASYESCGNSLVPDKEVCNLYQAKISFLIYKYYLIGLFDKELLDWLKSIMNDYEYNYMLLLISTILKDKFNITFTEE